MAALANIQIRSISNGYVVTAQDAPEALGYCIDGTHERFYASLDDLAADAESLIRDAIVNGESAIAAYKERAEREHAQYVGMKSVFDSAQAKF